MGLLTHEELLELHGAIVSSRLARTRSAEQRAWRSPGSHGRRRA